MSRIVRFRDLAPSWNTKQAKEPGFMRWLVTWMGGPAGHINTNPGTATESPSCAVGMMYLPRGQRQAGRHIHGVTEIYVVLQGEVEGFDASGHPHRAGPMDCTYIPVGCPHGVRNCGMEDVILVWVHDGIERNDAARYYGDEHRFDDVPAIDVVRFADLQASWSAQDATVAGTMRWSVNWVTGPEGAENTNAGVAARNDKIAIGMTVIEPGHAMPGVERPMSRLYLLLEGEAMVGTDALGYLDSLYVPAGEVASLRNSGLAPLRLMWVDCVAEVGA